MVIEINLILVFFIFLLLIHYLLFLLRIFKGLNKLNSHHNNKIPGEFITVIIPFRNEEENILANLESIESQSYPKHKFEVIYVDDFSEDNSRRLLCDNKTSENIKVMSVPKSFSPNAHKKRAIRYGIENSKGEIIVTTDADCIYDKDWLRILLSCFDEETGFVSAPVEFKNNNSSFSDLQKIEFAGLVLAGAGLIGSGKPTICNAANIAYRRKVFEEVRGFEYQMKLSSGDDELLMQKIVRDTNFKVKFSLSQNSIVSTLPNKSVKDFYHQRKRWASKGLFYADKSLVLRLILIYLFYLSLLIQPALALFVSNYFIITFLFSISFKILIEYLILSKGKRILFNDLSMKSFFFAEILQPVYIIVSGFTGIFGNFIWKERKIKR